MPTAMAITRTAILATAAVKLASAVCMTRDHKDSTCNLMHILNKMWSPYICMQSENRAAAAAVKVIL